MARGRRWGRRRYRSSKGRVRRYGGQPSPLQLHREMNAVPKQKKKREAWLSDHRRRFDFVVVPLARVHGTDDPSAYHKALKKALLSGAYYSSLADVPLSTKTVVFLVHKKGDDPPTWSSPELRVQSRRVDGRIVWRHIRKPKRNRA